MTFEEIRHCDTNTPRYRRAREFANIIQSVMIDYLPRDHLVSRRIDEMLLRIAWERNLQILSVPQQFDDLNKLELEHAFITQHPLVTSGSTAIHPLLQGFKTDV